MSMMLGASNANWTSVVLSNPNCMPVLIYNMVWYVPMIDSLT